MNIEERVQKFFSLYGVQASKIPELTEDGFKSPDFEIQDDVSILVEVKEKFDDKALIVSRDKALDNDGLYEHTEALQPQRRYKSIFKHAAEQLTSQKERVNGQFCFIFMVMSSGVSQKSQREQAFSTLYGSTFLLPVKNKEPMKKVLYYTHSEFFNLRDILDGVFIVENGNIELLINDKSPRYQKVIESKFVGRFSNLVFDPMVKVASNTVYYCDAEIPRNDELAIKTYLLEKYGFGKRDACFMDMPNFITHANL
ncbi:TPA: hypothetical protein ACGFWZ_003386 [Vibrio cholerae]